MDGKTRNSPGRGGAEEKKHVESAAAYRSSPKKGIATSSAAWELCAAGDAVRVKNEATPLKAFRGLRYPAVLIACLG